MACVRLHRKRWVADFRDQHGRRRVKRPKGPFLSKAEERRAAQELLAELLEQVRSGRYRPGKEKPSFGRLADLWLASKVRLRATTAEGYKLEVDCYLKPYFSPRVADEITAFEIEKFRDELKVGIPAPIEEARKLRHPNLGPLQVPGVRVINRLLTRLNCIMRYGCRNKLVVGNPVLGVEKLPTGSVGRAGVKKEDVLMPHELQRLIEHSIDPWKAPIMFAVYTGARRGEICGLKWSDIDWHGRTALIERSYVKGGWYPPKTKAGLRTVELPDVLVTELKRWQQQCPKSEINVVFPGLKGAPMEGNDLLKIGLQPALARAGIRRIRFHYLRHSFASILLSSGWDVLTVSRLLGHANPQVTLVIYAHALPRARHGAADALAQLMLESPNPSAQLPALPLSPPRTADAFAKLMLEPPMPSAPLPALSSEQLLLSQDSLPSEHSPPKPPSLLPSV